MTKPLSEQVAELEAKQHHLWDVKEAIRVENFELWSKNERLEAERDDLQRQVQEARDENERLRAKVERDFPCCEAKPPETIASEDVPFKGMTDIRYKEPQPTGYADDDHQDAEVLQWHQPTPRLTVHDLEVAPIGSVMRYFDDLEAVKVGCGWWVTPSGRTFSNAEIIESGWGGATLTTPEADDE